MTIYEWSSLARATPLYRHPDLPYGEAMNPKENLDNAFDTLAEGELRRLERALSGFDPDEVDASIGGDVLTLTLGDGAKIIINRHRAARQIWMAAHLPGTRQAWHFSPAAAGAGWVWSVEGGSAQLRPTLSALVGKQLGRTVPL